MTEYDQIADLLMETAELRTSLQQLSLEHFELHTEHFGNQNWWTKAGAGSPQELSAAVRDSLVADRSTLTDYWSFPSGKHNPYLDLLYGDMAAHGRRVRELPRFEAIDSLPSGSTLHVHWIESLRPNSNDEEDNQAALDLARDSLLRFVADSANTLVWSVHEPLPHGSKWPEQDAEFLQFLSDTAHVIHVLHESTASLCADYYTIDEAKTICVKLPLYTGVYSEFRTRQNARAMLEVADDELCIVFVGALRLYKGLDQLLEATARAAENRKIRLLIAGMPVDDAEQLVALVATQEHASIAPMLVPDTEMQTLLRAADLLAVPYQRFLNSAVLMLGLTFGVPVVATRNPVTEEAEASGLVTTFQGVNELAAALANAAIATTTKLDPTFAAAHHPHTIARAFAEAVTQKRST